MTDIFLKVLNAGLIVCWMIPVVLILRLLLKKVPKKYVCLLWVLVAVRLLLPFPIESGLSLVPTSQVIVENSSSLPEIHSGIEALNNTVNPLIEESFAPTPYESADPYQIIKAVGCIIWVSGITAMLVYCLVCSLLLHHRVSESVKHNGNVYYCDNVPSPFILGLVRPKIYLPAGTDEASAANVILHEKAHIRRLDHIWKPLGFLVLSVYWFNPLLWVCYILLCRDIELACDEAVVSTLDNSGRADYSETLLRCGINRKIISACPLAFGEVGIKERVRNVLNYKKPSFWIIIVSVVLCIATAVCFITVPKIKDKPVDTDDSTSTDTTYPYIVHSWTGANADIFNQQNEFTLSEFPGVTFTRSDDKVTAEENGIVQRLYAGMPVWDIYFIDLTGDGYPEICSTVSFGSGYIDERLIAYDYVTKTEYMLCARFLYNYCFHNVGDTLYVFRYGSDSGSSVNNFIIQSIGYPAIENGELVMKTLFDSCSDGLQERTEDYGKYKYYKYLEGCMPNADKDSFFVVLTNDPDITFDRVAKSIYSSNSDDFLDPDETVILFINTLYE